LLIPLPWLLFAYIQTGNPIYPIGSLDLAMPLSWKLSDLLTLFTHAADPISPVYIITAPLLFFIDWKNQSRGVILITAYVLLALLFWFIFPHTGGSRFFLPYIPALSVLSIIAICNTPDVIVKKALIVISLSLSLVSITYRLAANTRYLPVIFGQQKKSDFLTKNLNFTFGDYYDIYGFFRPTDKVFPLGLNNLYYLNAQLILPPNSPNQSDYLLIRYTDSDYLVDKKWHLINENALTRTRLFSQKIPPSGNIRN
jgi:hypothetical protein